MKITFSDEGSFARIWINGPFWEIAKARRLADEGVRASPVQWWESRGLTYQITLYGKNSHVLRAYKRITKVAA
ncbi:hypothetical protein ACU9CR_003723 [Cronobacter dublinensis]